MSKSALVSQFKSAFRKPSFFKEWDHYIKNPEEPDEDIPDFYGDMEDWEDDIQKAETDPIKKMGYKGTPKGKTWETSARAFLNKKLNEFIKSFSKAKFSGNKLIIYRAITTHGDNEELIEEFNDPNYEIGVYWSWEEEPDAHWGGRGRAVVVTGLVDINNIDIPTTLMKNLHPTLSEEAEITLKPKANLIVTQVNEGPRNVLWKGKKVIKASNYTRSAVIGALRTVIAATFPADPSKPGEFEKYRDEYTDIGGVYDIYRKGEGFDTQKEADQAFLEDITEVYKKLKTLTNPFPAYRQICVDTIEAIDTDFGPHWSWKKNSKILGTSTPPGCAWYHLEVQARKSDIDWYLSIARHLEWPEEYEILFDHGRNVEAKLYTKDWEFIKTIKGKITAFTDW